MKEEEARFESDDPILREAEDEREASGRNASLDPTNHHLSMIGTPIRKEVRSPGGHVSYVQDIQEQRDSISSAADSSAAHPIKISKSYKNAPVVMHMEASVDGASNAGSCASVLASCILIGILLEMIFKGVAVLATNGSDFVFPSYPLYCFAMVSAIPLSGAISDWNLKHIASKKLLPSFFYSVAMVALDLVIIEQLGGIGLHSGRHLEDEKDKYNYMVSDPISILYLLCLFKGSHAFTLLIQSSPLR